MRCPDCESYTAADAERCWKCGRYIAGKPPEPEAAPATRRERKKAKREAKEQEREAQRRVSEALQAEQERKAAAAAQLEQAAASVAPSRAARAASKSSVSEASELSHLQVVDDPVSETGPGAPSPSANGDGAVAAPSRARRRAPAAKRSSNGQTDAPPPVREGPSLTDIVNVATGTAPAPRPADRPVDADSNGSGSLDRASEQGGATHDVGAQPAAEVDFDDVDRSEGHDEQSDTPEGSQTMRSSTEEIDWSGRSRDKKPPRARRHVVATPDEPQPAVEADEGESRSAARTRRRKNKARKRRQLVSNFCALLVICGVVAGAGYAVFYYVIS